MLTRKLSTGIILQLWEMSHLLTCVVDNQILYCVNKKSWKSRLFISQSISGLNSPPPSMGSPWPFELLKISLFRFPPPPQKKKNCVQMPCPNFFCKEQGQQPRISAQAVLFSKTLKTFSSEPFAFESVLFTLNTSIFKDSLERLNTSGSNSPPSQARFKFPTTRALTTVKC